MKTVGIVGFHGFGEFLAGWLDGHVQLRISSRSPGDVPEKWRATLAEAARCDYLVLSIPLSTYPVVLEQLRGSIGEHTVIVDVCSVKIKPIELIQKIVPGQRLIATHPLFGPQTAADSLVGHTLVICPEVSDDAQVKIVGDFAQSLGLKVVQKSAEQHDKDMAVVHGLTFFVARTLMNAGIHDVELQTPSFQKLLSLAELEMHHSSDLFNTIQSGNPYTKEVRELFVAEAMKINEQIDSVQDTLDGR